MKNKVLTIASYAFLSLSYQSAYANFEKNTDWSPIQPILVYDDSQESINPFQMVSWGFGGSVFLDWSRNYRSILTQSRLTDIIYNRVGQVKCEVPYYRDKITLGFDVNIRVHRPDARRYTVYNCDFLFAPQARWPLYTALGSIAFNISPKLGLLIEPVSTIRNPDSYTSGIGGTVGLGLGADYYFNQWLGIYVEGNVRYNRIQGFITYPSENQNNRPRPYGYFTNALMVGIKTTF